MAERLLSEAVVVSWMRSAFEYGFDCGKAGSRTVVNPDGLEDAADRCERTVRASIAAIARASQAPGETEG